MARWRQWKTAGYPASGFGKGREVCAVYLSAREYGDTRALTNEQIKRDGHNGAAAVRQMQKIGPHAVTPEKYAGKELLQRVRDGWPEMAREVEALSQQLRREFDTEQVEVDDIRRRNEWSDAGDELDYDRFRDGQFDTAWRRTRRRARGTLPTVTLAWNLDVNSSVSSGEFKWSPIAALAATDMLEAAGYSVQLASVTAGRRGGFNDDSSYAMHAVIVEWKRPDEPLNISRACGMLCSSDAFRLWGFRAIAATGAPLLTAGNALYLGGSRYETNPETTRSSEQMLNDEWDFEGKPYLVTHAFTKKAAKIEAKRLLDAVDQHRT